MRKLLKLSILTVIIAFLLSNLPSTMHQNLFNSNTEVKAFEVLADEDVNEQLISVQLKKYLGNKTTVPIILNGDYTVAEDSEITLQSNENYQVKVNSSGELQLINESTILKTFNSHLLLFQKHIMNLITCLLTREPI